jgi:hypothetical protein
MEDGHAKFYWFAVGLGGVVPIYIFCAMHSYSVAYNSIYYVGTWTVFIIGSSAVIIPMAALVTSHMKLERLPENRIRKVVGISSIIIAAILILSTGGFIQSPFSFHVVYIPSIVAVVFYREKSLIKQTCAAYFLMGSMTIILPKFTNELSFLKNNVVLLNGASATTTYQIMYMLILLCQMLAVALCVGGQSGTIKKLDTASRD